MDVDAEHVIRALQQRIAQDAYQIALLQAQITGMEIQATKDAGSTTNEPAEGTVVS